MSLGEFLRGALTGGGGEVIPESAPLREQLDELRSAAGSRRAAARAAGVPESTWRRWEKGAHPKTTGAEAIGRAVRGRNLSPDAPTDGTLRIRATDRNGTGRERNRVLDSQALKLRAGTMDRVKEAYLRGDDAGAAKALIAGVGDDFYRRYLTRGETPPRGPGGGGAGRGGTAGSDSSESGEPGGDGEGSWDGGDDDDESGDDTGDYDYESGDLAYEGGDDGDSDSDPIAAVLGIG